MTTVPVHTPQTIDRARERFAVQDYYGAIHLLDDLVDSGRAFADAYNLLGLSYHMIGRRDKALEHLDHAVSLNPRYVEAHVHRGIVLNELGRVDEAEVAFAQARECRGESRFGIPGHTAAKLANQHAELAEAYVEAGATSRAIDQYQAALELGPGFHDLRYRLARLLLDAGRSLEARDELERVIAARPGFVEGRAALGLACYLSGDALAAERTWQGLLRDAPEDGRARAYLAMLKRNAEV